MLARLLLILAVSGLVIWCTGCKTLETFGCNLCASYCVPAPCPPVPPL